MRLQGVYISSHLSPQFAFSQAKTAKKKTNKQTNKKREYLQFSQGKLHAK